MNKLDDRVFLYSLVTAFAFANIAFFACAVDTSTDDRSIDNNGAVTGSGNTVTNNDSGVNDESWSESPRIQAGVGGSSSAVAGTEGSSTAMDDTGGSSMATAGTPDTVDDAPIWQPGDPCGKTIECGGVTCSTEGISGGVSSVSVGVCMNACCSVSEKCGVRVLNQFNTSQCNELDQDGQETSDCPTMFEMAGFADIDPQDVPSFSSPDYTLTADIRGCCRPDGRCGWLLPNFGVGCLAIDDIQYLSPLFALIVLPPIYCEYEYDIPR